MSDDAGKDRPTSSRGPRAAKTPVVEPCDESPAGQSEGFPAATRRSFLRSVGKKALYVTPLVMTLAAREAQASSFTSIIGGCGEVGSPCNVHADCCSGMCTVGSMTECT